MAKDSKPRGRPTVYAPELANEICQRLADGQTLREICRDERLPPESTVRRWALDDRGGFAAQYTQAREVGYLRMADEILEIADDGTNDWVERQNKDGSSYRAFDQEHYQRSRLRFDARRWLLSKALPKVYGDKLTTELTGKDGAPLVPAISITVGPAPASQAEPGASDDGD